VEHNIIKKSGSWFSYGDIKLGQGRDAVKTLFLDNTELCEEIETKIRVALSSDAVAPVLELATAK
jgi:recombination protein RecA